MMVLKHSLLCDKISKSTTLYIVDGRRARIEIRKQVRNVLKLSRQEMEIAGARGVAMENKKKLMGWESPSEMRGPDLRLNMGAEEGEEGKKRTT